MLQAIVSSLGDRPSMASTLPAPEFMSQTVTPVPPPVPLSTRLLAEAVGSAFLVIAVIGSGIMAETLSPDDVGLQLFENAAATAGALIGLIIMFATVSGAHFNPAVTLLDRLLGLRTTAETAQYAAAQVAGGCVGAPLGSGSVAPTCSHRRQALPIRWCRSPEL